MKDAAGREALEQLDAADLDDAVLAGIEASGFSIKDDLAHRITPLCGCISEATAAIEPRRAAFPVSSRMIGLDRIARRSETSAGIDDEIGALALFGIGHLPGQDRLEFFRRHAWPRQHAFALDFGRRGDDDDLVDAIGAAGFEQQGNVEHRERRAGGAVAREKRIGIGAHQRMHDLFQPGDRLRHRRRRAWQARRGRRRPVLTVPGNAASTSGAAAPE